MAVLGSRPLFVEAVEFFLLFRGQFVADFAMDDLHFLVHQRGDGFPKGLGPFLAGGEDFLNGLMLFLREAELTVHAPEQVAAPKLPGTGGLGIEAVGWFGGWILTRFDGRADGDDLLDAHGVGDEQPARHDTRDEYYQGGGYDLPGIHQRILISGIAVNRSQQGLLHVLRQGHLIGGGQEERAGGNEQHERDAKHRGARQRVAPKTPGVHRLPAREPRHDALFKGIGNALVGRSGPRGGDQSAM